MSQFTFHTLETATGESKDILNGLNEKYGFVPNLFAYMAEAPVTIKAYAQLTELLSETSFTPQEQQYALLAVSVLNDCKFCTAAHTAISKGVKADQAIVKAIVNNEDVADAKIATLVDTVKSVVESKGWTPEADLTAFFEAGYTQKHYLELILIVSIKTLSNYINHQTQPEVNKQFL